MYQAGRDIIQRLEHETPFRHARMRDCQGSVVNDLVTMEQQIKINDARLPTKIPCAAENNVLDMLEAS